MAAEAPSTVESVNDGTQEPTAPEMLETHSLVGQRPEQALGGDDEEITHDDDDPTHMMSQLRAQKMVGKRKFTNAMRALLSSIANRTIELHAVTQALNELESLRDEAMAHMGSLGDLYQALKDTKHEQDVWKEIETLEKDYEKAADRAVEWQFHEAMHAQQPERRQSTQLDSTLDSHSTEAVEHGHSVVNVAGVQGSPVVTSHEATQLATAQVSSSSALTCSSRTSTSDHVEESRAIAGSASVLCSSISNRVQPGPTHATSATVGPRGMGSTKNPGHVTTWSTAMDGRAQPKSTPHVRNTVVGVNTTIATSSAPPQSAVFTGNSRATAWTALQSAPMQQPSYLPASWMSAAVQSPTTMSMPRPISINSSLSATANPFVPAQQPIVSTSTNTSTWQPGAGQPAGGFDIFRKLKNVEIPTFNGDKRAYESWKAAFEACVNQQPFSPEMKLLQLRQYVTGEALKAIDNLGYSASAYEAALCRLERKFGGTRRQIAVHLEELQNFQPIRGTRPKELERFADLLDVVVINMKDAGQHAELGNGTFYTQIQQKLNTALLSQYHRWILEHRKSESVNALLEWVTLEAEIQVTAAETIDGFSGNGKQQPSPAAQGKPPKLGSFKPHRTMLTTSGQQSTTTGKCPMCSNPHPVWKCGKFKEKTTQERWVLAKTLSLCYRCLGTGHCGVNCPRSRQCGVDGCRESHNRLLHPQRAAPTTTEKASQSAPPTRSTTTNKSEQSTSSQAPTSTEGEQQANHLVMEKIETALLAPDATVPPRPSAVTLRTVPVTLRVGAKEVVVNAMLDDGSTKSYLSIDAAQQLGLLSDTRQVTVKVLNGQVQTFASMPVEFQLCSHDGTTQVCMSADTVPSVTGTMKPANWQKRRKQWAHLQNVDFLKPGPRPVIDLLIGLDYSDLHYSIHDVKGEPGEPIARLTPLGWTCVGTATHQESAQESSNMSYSIDTGLWTPEPTVSDCDAPLDSLVKQFWEMNDATPGKASPPMSPHEHDVLSKTTQSLQKLENHYQIALPWKDNQPSLPDNFAMALKRLRNTEARLQRDNTTASAYAEVISSYVRKGYVKKVNRESDTKKQKWYLPHFPILRPDKSTTKIRIVFDASAKCQGVSLNDAIFAGPKLQQSLFEVLLRFRKNPVAVVCDVAEMYLQVELLPSDRPFHRFLWREMDSARPPDEYEFQRLVFGVNASPFLAQLVSQQHAKSVAAEYPRAAEAVMRSTYMDDTMDSVASVDDAKQLFTDLTAVWAGAGMYARKWLSNKPAVLEAISPEARAKEINLTSGELPAIKTLGVLWKATEDLFTFQPSEDDEFDKVTKRMFLRKLAALFDPLGFLLPLTVRGRILLQKMWVHGLGWDDQAPPDVAAAVNTWLADLSRIHRVTVPRCLQPQLVISSPELHVFCDASTDAYGAVAYCRQVNSSEKMATLVLIAARARVAR